MSTTIEDRVILVLRELSSNARYGCWQRLADQTSMTPARWRKVYSALQRPTPDMLQALCRLRPEYAFWIVTGITDAENGHKAPESALPFPEWRAEHASDEEALFYFNTSLELLELLTVAVKVDLTDPAARLDAFGCLSVKEQWQPNPAVDSIARELREDVDAILNPIRKCREATQGLPREDRQVEIRLG